ncbi:hypothetical protein FRC20_009334 [Serendipita sp. 405]|nr:hypothetical protein FRC20_009334 [Serendipita sp. 405]
MSVVVSSNTNASVNPSRRTPLGDTTANALDLRHTPQPSLPIHKRGNSTSSNHISYCLDCGMDDKLEHSFDRTHRAGRGRKYGALTRLMSSELAPVPESDAEREMVENYDLKEDEKQGVGLRNNPQNSSSSSSPTGNSRVFAPHRRTSSYPSKCDENKVLYSSRTQNLSSDKGKEALDLIVPIPSSGLSEEEELEVIGVGANTRRTAATPPVFLSEPLRSEGTPRVVDYVLQLLNEDEKEEEKEEVVPLFQVKRKPPPPLPVPATRSLCDIQRDAMISRYLATKPITPSLLSFTDDTSRIARRRFHPLRLLKTRYTVPETDALRKRCIERRRLERVGLLDRYSLMGDMEAEVVHQRSSSSSNPYVFPRSGSLRHLRCPESNAWAEDWSLGYVDLSFIHKSLYSFDLRMRMGCVVGELWAEEEEEEILESFGRDREWEYDWECRWSVAGWLMNFDDDEEEEGSE